MLTDKQLTRLFWFFGIVLFAGYIYPHHYHPYREFVNDGLIASAIILAVGYLARASNTKWTVPGITALPLGLIVVIALQTYAGEVLFPIDCVFPIIYLIGFALAIVVGATMANQEEGVEKLCNMLAWVYLSIGLISVVLQEFQLFDLDATWLVMRIYNREKLRPYANMAQPNLLALILCFSLASIWWLYQRVRVNARVAIVFVLILLWGMALTQSRIAWIILPLFALFCAQRVASGRTVSPKYTLLLLVIFAGLVVALPTMLAWLGVPISTVSERAGQTGVRIVLWEQAWLISKMHPWLGVGWFQFGRYQAMLAMLLPPAEYSEYAHNIVLNFASEIGWPLTLAVFGGFAYWFYRCCIKRWRDPASRFLGLMIVAIAVHSMVEYPLWFGIILFPFGVMIGALNHMDVGERVLSVGRYWVMGFCGASALFIGVASWDYFRVMEAFFGLTQEQKVGYKGPIYTKKPAYTLYAQFFDYCNVPKISISQGMDPASINFLERASLRFAFPPVLMRLALAYALNNRQDEALLVLVSIKHLHVAEYENTYLVWQKYAADQPDLYKVIFDHMPKPDKVELAQ